MKRGDVLVALIIVGAGSLLWWRFGPGWREAVAVARKADTAQIALVAAFQVLYYVFAALVLRSCLRLLDVSVPFLWTLEATFLLVMLSRLLPGPGVTGPAVLYLLLQRRGIATGPSALAGPVFFLVDYAVYAVLLAGSLVWLAALGAGTGSAAAWVIGVASALALLAWAVFHPQRVERNLTRFGGALNRILERTRLRWRAPDGASGRALLEQTMGRLRAHPALAASTVLFGAMMALSDAASMASAFRAFGAHIGPAQAMAGYCFSTLGALLSVLPAGLGTFDAAMALAFSAFGAEPAGIASGIIVYRAIATALPGMAALIASRRLRGGG